MAEDGAVPGDTEAEPDLKIILLGDSAVGKSKLVERFLMDDYHPRQLSTYALTLFRHKAKIKTAESKNDEEKKEVTVDFWDTAGQERFASMHPSYYYRAHACLLVFDVTRKITYQHLSEWLEELRQYCEEIPVVCLANKVDVDYAVTTKNFNFPRKHKLPFDFVSAADGTNVVRAFNQVIELAHKYKTGDSESVIFEELLARA